MSGISDPPSSVEHQLDGLAEGWIAGFETRRRPGQAGGGRDEPVVHSAGQLDALLGRAQCKLCVSSGERCQRAIEEQTGQALGISEEPCLFDGRIEHFTAVAEIAAQHPDPREQHERETDHGRLAGRSGHGDHALRVDPVSSNRSR